MRTRESAAVAAVALGGGLGGVARYGCQLLWPGQWGTLAVNVTGCALIGVLTVLLPRLHHLARPLVGVGVLGGFTTFSAYAVDVVRGGSVPYLVATPVLCVAATFVAVVATRAATR
ncbi:hypothetical protein GCM10022243_46670 [Saccharothrix violaceirubra]|uniref:Fluoride-specific ion channel FluC n=1 Tax=Saccharothrix violaceirubra TaxID=413306 RepID=A0A7W7T729_9PSEU|nr:CrcB family protein [Saccharothrix violaceirubra]MBB4967792.1 CrcB protein [Saccharothrix violaceirubra]